MDFIPGEPEAFVEKPLEETVMPENLERAAPPRFGQANAPPFFISDK
jgi:hypothetical protein